MGIHVSNQNMTLKSPTHDSTMIALTPKYFTALLVELPIAVFYRSENSHTASKSLSKLCILSLTDYSKHSFYILIKRANYSNIPSGHDKHFLEL